MSGRDELGVRCRLVAELPLPARRAVDDRLVVAGELEPKLRTVSRQLAAAFLAGHNDCRPSYWRLWPGKHLAQDDPMAGEVLAVDLPEAAKGGLYKHLVGKVGSRAVFDITEAVDRFAQIVISEMGLGEVPEVL